MASIKNNKVTFRHPIVMKGKHGKVCAPSIQTYTELEQTQIKVDVELLVEAKPYSLADVPKRPDGTPLHDRALKAYFDPMEKAGFKKGKGGFRSPVVPFKYSDVRGMKGKPRRRNLPLPLRAMAEGTSANRSTGKARRRIRGLHQGNAGGQRRAFRS